MFFKRRDYNTELPFVSEICHRIKGDLIPDDDSKAVSCILPDEGFSFTYLSPKDVYILSFFNGSFAVSVTVRDRPDFFFDEESGGFVKVESSSPTFVKAFRSSNE